MTSISENAALPKPIAGNPKLKKIVVASAVGTVLELYDFWIYGYVASLIFERLFFPKFDPAVGTILVFATFSVGIIARPLGGLLFGHFGDRVGRKSILLFTLLAMGIATVAIGLLPTYAQIGVAAPLLLVTFRFIQGIALGGEQVGAVLMTIENAPPGQRGLYGSLIQAAAPLGAIAASIALVFVSYLPNDALLSWGWRLPFLFSLVLLAVGYYIRFKLDESEEFVAVARRQQILRVPVMDVLRRNKGATIIVLFAAIADTSLFYLATIFSLSYGTKTLGLPRSVLSEAILIASIVTLIVTPLLGAWSDRIGRRRMYLGGLVLMMISIYPFFLMLHSGNTILVTLAIVATVGVVHSVMWASSASYFPELFEVNVRFTGTSLGKQVGTVLGGGFIPLIATGLLTWSNNDVTPLVIYFVVIAGCAMVAVFMARDASLRAT